MSARASAVVPQNRVEALRSKHSILADRIEEAQRQPSTTDFYLRQLKKEKLFLKEKIEALGESATG
jgi:hypothetical protein